MKTILIVDDDRNLRRLYKAEFEAEGYRVISAEDGRRALELLLQEHPELVIMDIRMPDMDGLESMARMMHETGKVRVILNTGYSSYIDNFMTWAAEGFVIKSSDLTPLKEKVRQAFDLVPQNRA
jgi:DNA-binding NtrC family response regulator